MILDEHKVTSRGGFVNIRQNFKINVYCYSNLDSGSSYEDRGIEEEAKRKTVLTFFFHSAHDWGKSYKDRDIIHKGKGYSR